MTFFTSYNTIAHR